MRWFVGNVPQINNPGSKRVDRLPLLILFYIRCVQKLLVSGLHENKPKTCEEKFKTCAHA